MQNQESFVPTPVPPGKTEFVLPDGRRFALDLVETSVQLGKIFKENEGAEDGADLRAFGTWVLTQTGTDLSLSQVDWLWQHVVTERTRAKQVFQRELESLSSTGSTPADSTPEPS